MRIAFNPSTVAALTTPPNNKDITFDLKGRNIFARGVKFYGTDTNTWRPVVDNLTSNSTTSSLSANQGRVLKALIDGKSDSGHNHDGRYVRYYAVTTLDCNNLAVGLTAARVSATNAARTNHSVYLYISDIGTPFQIQIPDSDVPYIYKRYYSSGKWSGWFKLNAGYADSAGSVAWSNITGKPSSYTPSAHTHAWNSLTHSSTTENQAILTNGKANGWKLYTLNISGWNNAANNAHSHANKAVLDGITSGLVSNWNTAYNFVHTITGTDTDKVINKWDEIVNFLAGITEDNKLNTLLNSKLSVYELADKTNVGTIKNNGIYYSTSDASSSTLTNSPFNNGFTLINMTSYNGGDDLRRSRLAFNAYGEIKVSDDRGKSNTAETWYNVLTSKNSGISGSTIKLNGSSITVYSSGTADGRYVKKSGDTMSGILTIDCPNFGALIVKRSNDSDGASIQFRGKSNIYGYIGFNAVNRNKQLLRWNGAGSQVYTILDTSSTYTSSGKGVINGTTITQVDNADKLDGYHANTSQSPFGRVPTIGGDGVMEIGNYIDFHYDNEGKYDYSTRLQATGNHKNSLSLPSGTGTLALTSQIPNKNSWNYDDRYYTKAESNAKYITDITTSVNKLTFTKNGSSIARTITVNNVQSLGKRSPLTERNAISGIYTYGTYSAADNLAPTNYFETLGFGEGAAGTIEIGGSWISGGKLYWRALRDYQENWFSWKTILDSSNYSSILDSRYYTESEVNSLLSNKLNTSNFNWTNLPDKIVLSNEFNIVNAGFKEYMWFNYLPINDRSKTATILGYHFGNGNSGHTSIIASGFIKSGGNASQLLRADGGVAAFNWSGQAGQPTWLWGGNSQHSYYVYNPSNFRVAYAVSAGNADTLDGEHANSFVRTGAIDNKTDLNASDTYSFIKSVNSGVADHSPKRNTGWYNVIQLVHRNGSGDGPSYIGQIALGMTTNTDDMFFRGKRTDSWKTVIHSGNISSQTVASATKLQTARKIWGQSFDGTADVDNTLRIKKTTGSYCEGIRIQTEDGKWATIILGATADSGTNANAWSIHRKNDNNFAISRNSSNGANGLVMTSTGMGLGTTAPVYRLHVIGDQYTSGWSRANNGFYCEGVGVHFSHNGSVGEIAMTSNNEFTWGSNIDTLYFNFRKASRGITVTKYIWNAGSSTSWANHSLGALDLHGDVYWTNGDATMKIYGVDTCCGKENVAFQSTFDGENPLTSTYVTKYRSRSAILLQPRGGNVGINVSHDPEYALTIGGDTYSSGYVRAFSGFIRGNSSNSYVLLGGGSHKLESALNVANADTTDGVHINWSGTNDNPTYLASWDNNGKAIRAATRANITVGNSDKLDGYHENSFLRYRGATNKDQEATLWNQIGIKEYQGALPDSLTGVYNYGSVISLPGLYSRFEIYASHQSSTGNGLYYRSGGANNKQPWCKFIDSSNIGSQSVNYANSATSTTKVIVNQHTTNDANYPLVWSNQSNTNNTTENQLFKSWADLYYNPRNKRLCVAGSAIIGASAVPSYTLDVRGSVIASYWLRTRGVSGWYSESYGGGIYMLDTTWIRTYGDKPFYCNKQIYSSDSIRMGDIYLQNKNEINNGANGPLYLNVRNSGNVEICGGGGHVKVGHADFGQKLNVAGSGYFSDTVYSNTLNHTSSTGCLIIGNKTKEISIRSSNQPDVPAVYLYQKFSTNVYYTANKGFGIRPYYLSSTDYRPTETISGNTYSVVTVGDSVQAISCIIADKANIMSQIRGTLIRFLPGDDGQIVLLKDLNNYGAINGYFYVQPKGCNIIGSNNSNIYIADGNISNAYDDGKSRFFIYAKTHKVWIEFYCN